MFGEAAAQKTTENKTGRDGSHIETKLCGGNPERGNSDKRRSTNEDEERPLKTSCTARNPKSALIPRASRTIELAA